MGIQYSFFQNGTIFRTFILDPETAQIYYWTKSLATKLFSTICFFTTFKSSGRADKTNNHWHIVERSLFFKFVPYWVHANKEFQIKSNINCSSTRMFICWDALLSVVNRLNKCIKWDVNDWWELEHKQLFAPRCLWWHIIKNNLIITNLNKSCTSHFESSYGTLLFICSFWVRRFDVSDECRKETMLMLPKGSNSLSIYDIEH